MDKNNEYLAEANELLATLSGEDITSFVASLLADHPAVRHRFLRRFGPFDLERAKSDLLMDLRQAEYDNSAYGNGFIDWRHSSSFESDIRQLTEDHINDVLVRGDFKSALALGFEAYLFLTQVDVDGSGGFTDDALDVLDGTWDAIFETAHNRSDDALLSLLYDMLTTYTSNPDIRQRAYSDSMGYDIYDYQCNHIEGYLVDRFCTVSTHAPSIQALADQGLASAIECFNTQREENERMGRPFYGRDFYMHDVVRWVLVRLRCMETTEVPYNERLAFAEEYLSEKPVCLHLVDEREQAGDYVEALRLLEERLDKAREKGELAPDWALARAIGFYEREDNGAAVRNLLEQIVVSGAHRSDAVDWFRKLRGMCGTDEWTELRETILAHVDDNRSRWLYYVEESLFDRLMDEVETEGVVELGDFERHLALRYPERVLALHKKDLLGRDGNNPPVGSTRKAYASYADRVRHVRALEGGNELADYVIARVLKLYPRRPALRDELASA